MDTQPATLDVEADMLDIGLYVAEQLPDRPLLVFGPAGEECVFPDLAPHAGEELETPDVFALFHAKAALEVLGYHPDDMEIRQLRSREARYDRAGPLRQRRAVYRLTLMGVDNE